MPILQQVQGFAVSGKTARTKNDAEFNASTAKIPRLWEQVFHEANKLNKTPFYGVYHDYELDASGYYTVTVGVQGEAIIDHDNTVTIVSGKYLVFAVQDSSAEAMINTWQIIWDYFARQQQWQRSFCTDFEIYSSSKNAIYIGIE